MGDKNAQSFSIENNDKGGYDVCVDGLLLKDCAELTLHMKAGEAPYADIKLWTIGEVKTTLDCIWVQKGNAPFEEGRSKCQQGADS